MDLINGLIMDFLIEFFICRLYPHTDIKSHRQVARQDTKFYQSKTIYFPVYPRNRTVAHPHGH